MPGGADSLRATGEVMSKGLQIAVGAAFAALLLGWYGYTQIRDASFVYYQTLDEFRARGGPGEAARVHGYVAAGSIERDVGARQVRFAVQAQPPHAGAAPGEPLAVVYAGLETPDLFKDGAEVVLEGMLAATGQPPVFHADKLLAKCPSKFEGVSTETASF